MIQYDYLCNVCDVSMCSSMLRSLDSIWRLQERVDWDYGRSHAGAHHKNYFKTLLHASLQLKMS